MIPSIWWTKLYCSCEYTRVQCNYSCLTKCCKVSSFLVLWKWPPYHRGCRGYSRLYPCGLQILNQKSKLEWGPGEKTTKHQILGFKMPPCMAAVVWNAPILLLFLFVCSVFSHSLTISFTRDELLDIRQHIFFPAHTSRPLLTQGHKSGLPTTAALD